MKNEREKELMDGTLIFEGSNPHNHQTFYKFKCGEEFLCALATASSFTDEAPEDCLERLLLQFTWDMAQAVSLAERLSKSDNNRRHKRREK